MDDYYRVLGVTEDASQETIKRAYRKLATQLHPDRNVGDRESEERFKSINAAYDILKDPQKRKNYDSLRNGSRFASNQYGFRDFPDFDLAEQFSDIFWRATRTHQRPRNRDINVMYTITLDEAFHGKETDIHYIVPNEGRRSTSIRVPAGVDNTTKIRFPGQGAKQVQDAPPGDLYVVIKVSEHPIFERNGKDLIVRVTLDVLDVMAGVETVVPTIDGKEIRVSIPNGVRSGQIIRISGRGMPGLRDNSRGDMYVYVDLKLPENLTEDDRILLQKIREKKMAIHA